MYHFIVVLGYYGYQIISKPLHIWQLKQTGCVWTHIMYVILQEQSFAICGSVDMGLQIWTILQILRKWSVFLDL